MLASLSSMFILIVGLCGFLTFAVLSWLWMTTHNGSFQIRSYHVVDITLFVVAICCVSWLLLGSPPGIQFARWVLGINP